jgi:hypothetical protein
MIVTNAVIDTAANNQRYDARVGFSSKPTEILPNTTNWALFIQIILPLKHWSVEGCCW